MEVIDAIDLITAVRTLMFRPMVKSCKALMVLSFRIIS